MRANANLFWILTAYFAIVGGRVRLLVVGR